MKRQILRNVRRILSTAAAAKIRLVAAARGTRCDLDFDPTASISTSIHPIVDGPGQISIRVGAGSVIEDGVVLQLGPEARLDIGPDVTIRGGCILNVTGHLTFVGSNLLSWNSVVHCASAVTFEAMAGTGEMVTVVDGTHFRRGRDDHWYHSSATAPVVIGKNAWLASKSTVGRGVRIGTAATVAANSLVRGDVPDECLAMGVPAEVVRREINRRTKTYGA